MSRRSGHPYPDLQDAERAYRREHPVTYPTGRNLSGTVVPPSPEVAAWMAARSRGAAFRPPKTKHGRGWPPLRKLTEKERDDLYARFNVTERTAA